MWPRSPRRCRRRAGRRYAPLVWSGCQRWTRRPDQTPPVQPRTGRWPLGEPGRRHGCACACHDPCGRWAGWARCGDGGGCGLTQAGVARSSQLSRLTAERSRMAHLNGSPACTRAERQPLAAACDGKPHPRTAADGAPVPHTRTTFWARRLSGVGTDQNGVSKMGNTRARAQLIARHKPSEINFFAETGRPAAKVHPDFSVCASPVVACESAPTEHRASLCRCCS